jgi:hypothetical protein
MSDRKPTIYEVLKEKLGREPSHKELVADVKRILRERYEEQCERYPRTREIPLSRYMARNTRDAIRNANPC